MANYLRKRQMMSCALDFLDRFYQHLLMAHLEQDPMYPKALLGVADKSRELTRLVGQWVTSRGVV
ncbi:hypothetical protein [Nonomuraea jabiensis]|uniref:Uncharacterized protein n=1 Tax=Nonomuraea jabiensis TaxID=882448 RepID=A0A7W9G261_9ACTN|nr:hypothetical protein [Nonomuraea jabiensis]MBB5775877.1 hypothetical protein [Nonomuraea jabiensis]